MNPWRTALALLLGCGALLVGPIVRAVELPPSCPADAVSDDTTPLSELRRRVEAESPSDPTSAFRLMCATLPRVAREYGEDSVELAWWMGSLAMPLIAYMDRHAEAEPLVVSARTILERRLGPDAEELADLHVAQAWIHFRRGELAAAGTAWDNALRIRERWPGPQSIELQKALVGLAQAKASLRDFDGAGAALRRAREILERNGDAVSEAAAAIENVFTNVALRAEDYVAARGHAEAQIAIESRLGRTEAQLVPAYAMLGLILERLDEFEESERAAREAVRLSESDDGPLQRHRLAALTQLTNLLNARGRPAEALEVAERAVEVGQATLGADAPRLVAVLQNLAEALKATGQLPEALHVYERAGAIVLAHRDDVERHTLVSFHRGLGRLQLRLGEVEQARATLTEGLAAAGLEPTLSTERAQVLLGLAEAGSGTDAGQSRLWLSEALGLLRARLPGGHPTILHVINGLCAMEIQTDPAAVPDCDEVAERLEQAREDDPVLRRAVYANLSWLAEVRGDREKAYVLAVRALAAATALGTPEPLWGAYFRLAGLLGRGEQRPLAILFGKQAIAQIERLRHHFVGEDRRLDRGFIADKTAVYRTVADWLMEAGRLDEGLDVLRLLKREELYQFTLRDAAWGPGEQGVELSGGERDLWERYAQALDADAVAGEELTRLSRLREADRISVNERERLKALLAGQGSAEAARTEKIRAFIASGAPAVRQDAQGGPARSEFLARELGRFGTDSVLAFYLLTEDHLRVLVATRDGRTEVQVPLDARALRRDIGNFLDRIGRREDVTVLARSLYDRIAKPVDEAARRSGAKRLVLWLDGALRYVPFSALDDGRHELVDKYAIEAYAPAGDPVRSSPGRALPALSVLGLGVTREIGGYRALPGVADELCSVVRGPIVGLESASTACPEPTAGQGALPGTGFADAAFTEARLAAALDGPRDFSVLHLGTHFSLRPGNSLRSFLVLGDGSRLTLDRLRSLDFSGIELLTLSACQTGLGGAVGEDGVEVEGLSAIVQRRGAKRVVSSLWQVEDVSTARLMRAMYRELASDPTDATVALQDAQRTLRAFREGGRQPYAHPYYWAGFVISGAR